VTRSAKKTTRLTRRRHQKENVIRSISLATIVCSPKRARLSWMNSCPSPRLCRLDRSTPTEPRRRRESRAVLRPERREHPRPRRGVRTARHVSRWSNVLLLEALCHTGVFAEQRWRKLRLALAAHGVEPQEPLVVRICTRLEHFPHDVDHLLIRDTAWMS
jgi:hypothetical protein